MTDLSSSIAVEEQNHAPTNEALVRTTLARIHAEYVKAAMSPFHLLRVDDNEPITSRRMDRAVETIVSAWPRPKLVS